MKTEFINLDNCMYWISQVKVIHHYKENFDGDLEEEWYCPFCHSNASVPWNLFHEDGCPLYEST